MENNENLNEELNGNATEGIPGENKEPILENKEEPAFQPPPRRPRKQKNVKKIVLISLIVFLSVVLVAITAGFLYVDYLFGLVEGPSNGSSFTGDPTYDPWGDDTDHTGTTSQPVIPGFVECEVSSPSDGADGQPLFVMNGAAYGNGVLIELYSDFTAKFVRNGNSPMELRGVWVADDSDMPSMLCLTDADTDYEIAIEFTSADTVVMDLSVLSPGIDIPTTGPVIPTTGGTVSTDPAHTTKPTRPSTTTTQPTVPPTFPSVPPIEMGDHILNIMLLGLDKSGSRTDSMILCTVNTNSKKITLTSFMRDMLVAVPGKTDKNGTMYKLNAAYAMGGQKMLQATLLENFGVKIDEFVTIRMDKFPLLIDDVGGVDIKLTSGEVKYMKEKMGWNLEVGVNHLNGEQALFYARIRKIDSDHQRVGRQQKVLEAIFKAYKDKSVFELNKLMLKILDHNVITTTMTKDEMWGYAGSMFPMLSGFKLERKKVPDHYWKYDVDGDGVKEMMYENGWYKRQQVLIPNLEVCRKYLEQIINP